jgi:indole-3-glycerol phosphate synthase
LARESGPPTNFFFFADRRVRISRSNAVVDAPAKPGQDGVFGVWGNDQRKAAAVSDTLARINAYKRDEIAAAKARVPEGEMRRRAEAAPPPRGFAAVLRRQVAAGRYGLIAEIKRASPSKGLIRKDFDVAALARAYRDGGAACLSVLTDGPEFQGSLDDLKTARDTVDLPVLRKDFMLDPYQVFEARAWGADCILIIMASLSDEGANRLEAAAQELGMDALIEVHNADELRRALRLRSGLIGINNRNLKTLQVYLETTEALARTVPAEWLLVSESGLGSPADLARMARAGASCFLIGEALMRQADVAAATRALLAPLPESASA